MMSCWMNDGLRLANHVSLCRQVGDASWHSVKKKNQSTRKLSFSSTVVSPSPFTAFARHDDFLLRSLILCVISRYRKTRLQKRTVLWKVKGPGRKESLDTKRKEWTQTLQKFAAPGTRLREITGNF